MAAGTEARWTKGFSAMTESSSLATPNLWAAKARASSGVASSEGGETGQPSAVSNVLAAGLQAARVTPRGVCREQGHIAWTRIWIRGHSRAPAQRR